MRIDSRKTGWRLILLLGALGFVGSTVWYTSSIASDLKAAEGQRMEIWAAAQQSVLDANADADGNCDLELQLQILESNNSIPMILVDRGGRIMDTRNYSETLETDAAFFEERLQQLQASGQPIDIESSNFKLQLYYEQSSLISALEWFPVLQLALLSLFLLLGYWAFSTARRAEQEKVWLGMAKETAHQLGTPISSLMGWVQNLQMMYENDEDIQMISSEIDKDVKHLEIVAERFSKIGAKPELKPVNIFENLDKHLLYIRKRAPRRVRFQFPNPKQPIVYVHINVLLFDWVIENLLKNALDAMDTGRGKITVEVSQNNSWVFLDFSDTGKGIPKGQFNTIFKPGFSTKKRGWGLGLSLTKRIVERYHKGKIFVKQSTLGKGTTFRIQLPQKK